MKNQLTVKEFINILKKAKDIDIAPIEFAIEGSDKSYCLDSLSQFGICTDVIVQLKEYNPPLVVPFVPQRKQRGMVKKAMRRIAKDEK